MESSPGPYGGNFKFDCFRIKCGQGTFELRDQVSLTIHLLEKSQVERRSCGKSELYVTRAAGTFVDVPGSQTTVELRKPVAVLQASLPIDRIQSIASEDHNCHIDVGQLAAVRNVQDFGLLRLALQSRRNPISRAIAEREMVGWLISHTNGKVVDWKGGLTPTKLHRVYELVDSCFAEVSLTKMACEAGLSPYHFSREFKRSIGFTPWAYVTERRLTRAIALLASTRLTISEIARLSGYRHTSLSCCRFDGHAA